MWQIESALLYRYLNKVPQKHQIRILTARINSGFIVYHSCHKYKPDSPLFVTAALYLFVTRSFDIR